MGLVGRCSAQHVHPGLQGNAAAMDGVGASPEIAPLGKKVFFKKEG